ncbi:hypothetical protein BD289DRAFT_481998 [Coniella lustricola]|uniref:Rhodopsin domain-containing protein n=1 Tax=Coniella lustricola TaxID=2025994 RepID=A0A2T3AA98_9PEZI|nr:hypothetical protein BD289DRAFT_481998 [Coniella lustricola]
MGNLAIRGSDSAAILSEQEFKVVTWVCLGLCIIAFIIRAAIRIVCLGRLVVEDYCMVFALSLFVAVSAVLLVYMDDIYTLYRIERDLAAVSADFLDVMSGALRADGLTIILSTVGIWTVKLNFLIFFRRLARQVRSYTAVWISALVFILACGAASLSLMPFQCTFADVPYVIEHCTSDAAIGYESAATKAGVALDIVSDFVLICFPISILWRSQISLRQKISLSAIFSLEGLTIAATIVRGSVFGAQFYKSFSRVDVKALDFVWIMFWQYMEFVVSFLVACTASFRSFWATREQKARDDRYRLANDRSADAVQERHRRRMSYKPKGWEHLYGSVLESLNDLEGLGHHHHHHGAAERDLDGYLELVGTTRIGTAISSEQTVTAAGSDVNLTARCRGAAMAPGEQASCDDDDDGEAGMLDREIAKPKAAHSK